MAPKQQFKVLLVGNPNCGKTTIFNSLSGMRAKVGNYSGVTVDKKTGRFEVDGAVVEVEDLPGIYTLSASSSEEKIARDVISEGNFDLIVNVVDSSNFERNLYLTLQLAEMKLPFVIALNMTDELERQGKYIDYKGLSAALGIPIVKCVGYDTASISLLKKFILKNAGACTLAHFPWEILGENILNSKIAVIAEMLKSGLPEEYAEFAPWMAVRVLENDRVVLDSLKTRTPHLYESVKRVAAEVEAQTGESAESLVSAARYRMIDKICMPFLKSQQIQHANLTSALDSIFLNKIIGIPLFFLLMYAVFEFVFALGDPLMGIMESFFIWLGNAISSIWNDGGDSMLEKFLVDGVIGGVGGVFVFLPNIILLFFALAILEDSGYMARAAFLCDRIMKRFGLSGSSVIPMLIGFGCSVPAIIGTRTLKSRVERIATIMVIPLFSCGARFPVYVLLIPVFFPQQYRGAAMFGIYIIGIAVAMALSKLLRITALKGDDSSFLIELPPYRLPRLRNVLEQISVRAFGFIKKAGTIILAMSVILWAMSTFPEKKVYERDYDAEIAKIQQSHNMSEADKSDEIAAIENAETSERFSYTYMGRLGNFMEPVFKPLGFDNKLVSALIGALAAKEVFITQLGIIYGLGDDASEESASLRDRLNADYSFPQGISILLFILLSAPCIATISTTYAETKSWRIAASQFAILTLLAYLTAMAAFQIASNAV